MLVAIAPPQLVPVFSGFDYMTVDAQRRRVYAAHGGSRALLVVDADSGKVIGQVRVGPMAGVAVNEADGHVFTGNGSGNSVSEVDPVALKVVRSVDVPGEVDAIAYDPGYNRIYADEDDGTRIFVIDTKTFTLVKSISLPGHKPEYLAINPRTHEVYQNISDLAEVAVIDPATLTVKRTFPTPELSGNHPLQFDAAYDQIAVGGTNGVMSVYTPAGTKIAQIPVPRFDQCTLDPTQHILACAGSGGVTRIQLNRSAAPAIADTTAIDPGVHTTTIDPTNHRVWAVWSKRDGSGDFVQGFDPGR
jgi:DNA-binding beta-propeller fold protein YncE